MGEFLSNLKRGASPWREDDERGQKDRAPEEDKGQTKKKKPLSPWLVPVALAVGSVLNPSKAVAEPEPKPGITAPRSSEAAEILPKGSRIKDIEFKVTGQIVGNEWRAKRKLEMDAESEEGGRSTTNKIELDDRTHPHGTPPVHLSVSGDALMNVQGKTLKISLAGERRPGNLFEGEATLEIPFGLLQASSLTHLKSTSSGTLTKEDIDALFSSTGLAHAPGAAPLRKLLEGATYEGKTTGAREGSGRFGGTLVLTAKISGRGSDLDRHLRKFDELFAEQPRIIPSERTVEPLRGPLENPELVNNLDIWGTLTEETVSIANPFDTDITKEHLTFKEASVPLALRNPDIAKITFQVTDSLDGHLHQIILRVTQKTGETLVFVTSNGLSVTSNPQEAKFEKVGPGNALPERTENPEIPFTPPAEIPGEFEPNRVPPKKAPADAAKADALPPAPSKAAPAKASEVKTPIVTYGITGKIEPDTLTLTIAAQPAALRKLMNDDSQTIRIPLGVSDELAKQLAKGDISGSLEGTVNKAGVLEPSLKLTITHKKLKDIPFANIANLFDLIGLPADAFPDGHTKITKTLKAKELRTNATSGIKPKQRVLQDETLAVSLEPTSPMRDPDVTIIIEGDKFSPKPKKVKPQVGPLFTGLIEITIKNLGIAANADMQKVFVELKRVMRQEPAPSSPPPPAPPSP